MCCQRSARISPRRKPGHGGQVEAGSVPNVPPGAVAVVRKQPAQLLRGENPALLLAVLHLAHAGGRVPGDLLPVERLPEDHLHHPQGLVGRGRGVLRQKPRAQVQHVRPGDLGQPLGGERVAQDMVFQPLALNPGMPPGDALALFLQPADVRAAVPNEKRLGVEAEAQVALAADGPRRSAAARRRRLRPSRAWSGRWCGRSSLRPAGSTRAGPASTAGTAASRAAPFTVLSQSPWKPTGSRRPTIGRY